MLSAMGTVLIPIHFCERQMGHTDYLTAPIQAVPISYRPTEPIRQPQKGVCALGPFAGVLTEPNKRGTCPNSLVHATALACGARVVPLEEAGLLISAVESKIRSGGAIIAKLPSSNLRPRLVCQKIWPHPKGCQWQISRPICFGPTILGGV